MQTAFRLAYSVAVAIFFILVVIFGTRTLYGEPSDIGFYPPYNGRSLYCNEDGRCYVDGREITSDDRTLTDGEREYLRQQRDFNNDWDTYQRTVFIIAALLGTVLSRRVLRCSGGWKGCRLALSLAASAP